jgi:hypothetical protein
MRLLPPYHENPNDFAKLPMLLEDSEKKNELKSKLETKKVFELSFFVWIFVVTVLPIVTYKVFENEWNTHMI